jgi:hypothetical protein
LTKAEKLKVAIAAAPGGADNIRACVAAAAEVCT